MKILIIANGYPTDREPQWGCFERDQGLALQRMGHDVRIMYIDGRFRKEQRKIGISHFKKDGLNIYGIYWLPISLIGRFSIKTEQKLRQRMLCSLYKKMETSEGRPDIIYSHYLNNTACATILRKRYNIPLVGMEHWSVLNLPTIPNRIRFLGEMAYSKTDYLLAVSNALSQSIYRHFGRKSTVVYNMVGSEFFVQINNKKVKENDRFRFVAIGNLLPIKGFDILINAFDRAKLNEKHCKLIIVGGGIEYANLEQQIKSLSLTDSISLVGRKSKQEIVSILSESDAFVLSSHSETFSVVCIEAMALGLPIVATRCGGPEEFVTDKVGMLVKTNDVNALAEAMNEMYSNSRIYNRENIRTICKSKFAPEVIAQQLSSIFEEVVSNHKAKQ